MTMILATATILSQPLMEDNVHSKGETTQKSEYKPSILGQIRAYQNESKTGEKQTTKEQEYAI